jgi:hypothetical protein
MKRARRIPKPRGTDTEIGKLRAAIISGPQPPEVVTIASANFTRPADTTAYAVGDLVANSVTAGSVVPMQLAVARLADALAETSRIRLKKSGAVLTNAQFRVHLYRNSPTIANGDNGAWSTTESGYVGFLDVTIDKAFTDGAKGIGTVGAGNEILLQPALGTQNVFALLEARAAYTPASAEVFTLEVEVEQY